MSTLERAIEIAALAHAGQTDKAGRPYIAHPLRVALPFVRGGDEPRAIVAVLHDVIEDSGWTLDDLRAEGFGDAIVAAIEALTRRDGEGYAEFVRRAAADALARPVKLGDLQDNLSAVRLAALAEEKRAELTEKYRGALALLQRPG